MAFLKDLHRILQPTGEKMDGTSKEISVENLVLFSLKIVDFLDQTRILDREYKYRMITFYNFVAM